MGAWPIPPDRYSDENDNLWELLDLVMKASEQNKKFRLEQELAAEQRGLIIVEDSLGRHLRKKLEEPNLDEFLKVPEEELRRMYFELMMTPSKMAREFRVSLVSVRTRLVKLKINRLSESKQIFEDEEEKKAVIRERFQANVGKESA